MFQRSGVSEVSESYVNHGGALRILIRWELGRANILPIGVTVFTVIAYEGYALLTGRTGDAPPSGKTEGILLRVEKSG